MSDAPAHIFSHRFPGTIWNMLAMESENRLVLEVRDDVNFKVSFSLFNYAQNEFQWRDISIASISAPQDGWWVSLAAINKSTVLLNRFLNKGGNPDRKSLIALDAVTGTIRWEHEELSFHDWNESEVFAYRTKDDPVPVTVMLATGEILEKEWKPQQQREPERMIPVFYAEGTAHFDTVKKFIASTHYVPVKGVEYLEFNGWIILSIYIQESEKLANYLLVFKETGELALTVQLGEKLTGLGSETFFILSGCLFLVQNKTDLAAYRL